MRGNCGAAKDRLGLGRYFDTATLAINLASVDLLARLGNSLEDLFVAETGLGDNGGRLFLEGDFVRLDT